MYRIGNITTALTIALALGACSETPVGPGTTSVSTLQSGPAFAKSVTGTGLVLDNVTGLSLPLIGHVGDVTINQAIITQLGVVQDLAGNIIGVDATGALQLTGGVLGTDVITQNFTTDALILSSGKGQCDVLSVNLAPITLDALGSTVSVDVPQASVTPRASECAGRSDYVGCPRNRERDQSDSYLAKFESSNAQMPSTRGRVSRAWKASGALPGRLKGVYTLSPRVR
ncbi:MAG: hypothetical protein DMD72_11760 [Gemmatimonadetes bacterium]|nr:MAG: hypothetical protein DMD72_11760 [Gemmatimonadota bacterium]